LLLPQNVLLVTHGTDHHVLTARIDCNRYLALAAGRLFCVAFFLAAIRLVDAAAADILLSRSRCLSGCANPAGAHSNSAAHATLAAIARPGE
jgi:hypothetical protein